MNWIDINIICVGARKPKIYENDIYQIEIMNKDCDKDVKCYIENWDILNRIKGIWYELWSLQEDSDFLIDSTWKVLEIGEKSYGYQLFIRDKDRPLFEKIFNFYIECSPVKKIIVLFRHQGYENESVEDSMSVDDFLGRLLNREICGNRAYVLTKTAFNH